jgi:uncharacterized protein DUF4189
MIKFWRACPLAVAILAGTIGVANAAGAFAIGTCGAYGYAFDYERAAEARTAAAHKCSGTCKIAGEIRRACAALAIDIKHPCRSFGWATDPHLGKAENVSLHRCYQSGGRDCVVRAFACDEKG